MAGVWRSEAAKIVAAVTRIVRDVGLAEELAQDALVAALEAWPETGVPDNPGAWLTAVAQRRALDRLRRDRGHDRVHEQIAQATDPDPAPDQDDVLRLMFVSCHPVLPAEQRTALTLRLLGGLTTGEIARAFLVGEQAVARRVATAKRTLAEERVPFDLPAGPELAGRIASVLEVVYLIFNEGYAATSGDDLLRPALCLEALRLGRLLAELAPDEPEAHGLVALMEIQASRTAARTGPSGEPVRLADQNRGRWDQLLIRRGFAAMLRARDVHARTGSAPGPYVLQAAIAVCHAQAPTWEATDWVQIVALYDALIRVAPSPVVRLHRAVAVGMADGPEAGLHAVEQLATEPSLQGYALLPGIRGDLLARLGRDGEARTEFERAAALTRNAAERSFLLARAAAGPSRRAGVTLGESAAAFLKNLSPATRRSYTQTLRRLCRALGDQTPIASVTPARVTQAFATAWPDVSPRTWNRHRAAVRSFSTWTGGALPAPDVPRRAEAASGAGPLDEDALRRVWGLEAGLRERTLWRLLHESGAPVTRVLALDVEDLDLDDRRTRGPRPWITWRSASAALLADLVGERAAGPLFLTERRAPGAASPRDVCPRTGRHRLSYERAEYLFKTATRELGGLTLGRLRPGGPVSPS